MLFAGKFVAKFTVTGDEIESRLPVTSTRIEFVEPTAGVFVHATPKIVFGLAGFAKRRLCATHVPPICGACTG